MLEADEVWECCFIFFSCFFFVDPNRLLIKNCNYLSPPAYLYAVKHSIRRNSNSSGPGNFKIESINSNTYTFLSNLSCTQDNIALISDKTLVRKALSCLFILPPALPEYVSKSVFGTRCRKRPLPASRRRLALRSSPVVKFRMMSTPAAKDNTG